MTDLPNIYSQTTKSCEKEDPAPLTTADASQPVRYGVRSSRSSLSNSLHCRKSELSQQESNERGLITTKDAAVLNERVVINQLGLRKTAIELRTLMHQYSIMENGRGSSPFDAELHRSQFRSPTKLVNLTLSDAERWKPTLKDSSSSIMTSINAL